jgi:uncharacterized Zn finger protein
MQCSRCNGMRVPEIICEGGVRISALRCIHCGDIVDHVIARNRTRRQRAAFSRPRTPTYGRSHGRHRRFIGV